jgi:pilus assembly protein CpaE
MPNARNGSDAPEGVSLTVAILDSDAQRRKAAAEALAGDQSLQITEIPSFPARVDDLEHLLPQTYDVVLFNADCDRDLAFDLTQKLSANPLSYVMAYSSKSDTKMAVHVMRAGAREFFTTPVDPAEIAAAIGRATEHYLANAPKSKSESRLFVFLGTKGGCGVTTIAANFALALAQESEGSTLLIDFGLPLGDAAINLGIKTEYSVASAIKLTDRLDGRLLSTLVVKHSTGLAVLASPSEFNDDPTPLDSIDKLVTVARETYDFVVIDAGSRIDLLNTSVFDKSAIVYLITQVGISEMLNANRMVSKFFFTRDHTLQIVLNRYKPSDLLFDERKINEALTRPAQWKVPDDYAAARRTRETSSPMVLVDSAIARAIREMAQNAAGLLSEKSAKRSFFSFLR